MFSLDTHVQNFIKPRIIVQLRSFDALESKPRTNDFADEILVSFVEAWSAILFSPGPE